MYGILDERQTTMKAFIRMGYLRLVHSWNIISILSILGFQSAKWPRSYWFCSERKCNGHVTPPNRMNFWKNSKPYLTPPPHFRKIILQIVFGKRPKKNIYMKVQKLQYKFLDWKLPSPSLWKFSENSSVLVAWPVPKRPVPRQKDKVWSDRLKIDFFGPKHVS